MAAAATAAATSSEMEATATAITPAAAGPSPAIPEKYMYKNHLQSFSVRTYKKLPIYKVEFESDGKSHQLKFRCTVEVGGQQFSSAGSFDRKKDAEQDAARVAYEILATAGEVEVGGQQFSSAGSFDRKKDGEQDAARVAYEILAKAREDDIKEAFGLIDQDVVFCKSILHEFAVKKKITWPSYSVDCLIKPVNLFAATVVFDGNSYTGESATNKKVAVQNAARAVIKSILAKHNTCMVGIIISKKQLITAVRSTRSTPATFTPIQFIRPVSYAAYGGPDHVAPLLQNASSSSLALHGGANAVPSVGTSANPSSANVERSKSKKRKSRSQ